MAYVNDYITAAVDTTIPRIYNACMDPQYTKVFTNVDEALLTGFEAGFDWRFAEGWQYKIGRFLCLWSKFGLG